ncbi:cyclic nucleotide-binding-like protein [Obelidium mucronatum]|nr:cyclic nucleotide-binding-like protein [Obelidium mucronatum]
MSSEVSQLSHKLDNHAISALTEQTQLQEEAITQLTEEVKFLTAEVQTQSSLISMLKNTNQSLRKRALELIKANEEIREVTKAYLAIASQLRGRTDLSSEEKEIVKSSERARMLVQFSSMERGDNEDDLQSIESPYPSLSYPYQRNQQQQQQQVSENPVSDITVVKNKSRENQTVMSMPRHFHEEHPNIRNLIRFPLFASFPQEIMEQVSLASYEMRRKMGQIIVKKGEEGAEIFFLTEGIVSVVLEDKELSVLNAPIFFGELGVLFKFQRTATVVAKTDCTMVVVTKQKLDEIIVGNPAVRQLVDDFSSNKEIWWKKQQYVREQQNFGAEFAHDIARKDIKKLDIFSSAPDSFIDSLATAIKCLVYEPQQNIVSIDEDSDAMYFILDGTVEVVGQTGTIHAEIGGGAFFGEVGVLLNMKRTASIRCKEESHVFKLTKQDLDRVISDYPSMKTALQASADERYELFKRRTVVPAGGGDGGGGGTDGAAKEDGAAGHVPDQFDMEVAGQSLAKLGLFAGVEASVLSELAMKMIRKTWQMQEKIIVCNSVGDSMFFLAAGNAEVITEFDEVIDNVSGPSAYFGEVAILENVARTATVKCTSQCSTYELRKNDFKAVVSKYPHLAKQVKDTADIRMQNYLMRNVLA